MVTADGVPQRAVNFIEKRLPVCRFHANTLTDVLIVFPPKNREWLDGPFEETHSIAGG